MTVSISSAELSPDNVLLRTGPPTREELLVYYPAKFTWTQLKTFVNSGDLGLLKRDRRLQKRYGEWAVGIIAQYGSIVNYLTNHRLQWGKPDRISLLTSMLRVDEDPPAALTGKIPKYFTSDIPSEFVSIIQNDWPYSVPLDVEHTVIWTRAPVFHEDLIAPCISARIERDGLCGFTGLLSPPSSPSILPSYLSALSEWDITTDKLIRSDKGTDEEEALVLRAGEEVHKFVKKRWAETEWETAWFVNPPRLQSVPDLAHIHVFARQKL